YLLTAVFARPPTVESPLAFIPTALSRSPRIELSRTIHIRGETRGLVQHVVSAGAPAFLPSSCSRARAPTATTLFVETTLFVIRTLETWKLREGPYVRASTASSRPPRRVFRQAFPWSFCRRCRSRTSCSTS